MPIHIGIDEAGYGPILGPLVVSATAFQGDDRETDLDLWKRLQASVADRGKKGDNRIVVCDSKRIYTPAKGLGALELSVLSFCEAAGGTPRTLRQLIRFLGSDDAEMANYEWYVGSDVDLLVAADRRRIEESGQSLRETLAREGISVAQICSRPLRVREYNRQLIQRPNKARVLFHNAIELLKAIAESHPDEGCLVDVDKHGGRDRYGYLLLRAMGGYDVTVLEEGRERSVYRLVGKARDMQIAFLKSGDSLSFGIALASMFSKYVRELHLELFNRFWQSRIGDLRPTAGYASDGARFLADIDDELRGMALDTRTLIRAK